MNDPRRPPIFVLSSFVTALACAACAATPPAAAPVPASSSPTTLRALYGLSRPPSIPASRTAIVLVDFQEEFFHGRLSIPDGAAAVEHAAALLRWARANGVLVVHVRNVAQSPRSLLFAAGSPTTAIVADLAPAPGEIVLTKSMAGAFSRTDLDATLKGKGIELLVVGGIMTHLAVDTTVRDGMVLGYRVIVAADATATRTLPGPPGEPPIDHRTVQRASLAALADRFADVLAVDEIARLPIVR
ncbi:MAG: isochorismatase family protein [Minicystis sp.]